MYETIWFFRSPLARNRTWIYIGVSFSRFIPLVNGGDSPAALGRGLGTFVIIPNFIVIVNAPPSEPNTVDINEGF